MQRILTVVIALALALGALAGVSESNDSLISVLDHTVLVKDSLAAQRRADINATLTELDSASSDDDLYNVYRHLYSLYRTFRADSAIWVAERRLEAARRLRDRSKVISATLNLAESYSLAGNYYHSLKLLDSLHREPMFPYHRKYLYDTYTKAYARLAKSEGVTSQRVKYQNKSYAYRDSAIALYSEADPEFFRLRAARLAAAGLPHEALREFEAGEKRFGPYTSSTALAEQARIYHMLGDYDMELNKMLQAAIIDLNSSRRDYNSIMEVAKILNRRDDPDRAYIYIRCALEDASFCNAKGRISEILELVPIIDEAYSDKEQERNHSLMLLVGLVSVLAAALALAFWIAHRRLRENRQISKELNASNAVLKQTNRDLEESNRARERYISMLFDAHSGYINRMGQFRKSIMRLMKAGQYQEVLRIAQSDKTDIAELKELYARFDTIFLSMYPRFVDDYNTIVKTDCRVSPPEGSLTAELRVLALMRIGISSPQAIAELLHYTPQTVYNYKFAIRNALAIPKEHFDRILSHLGS